MDSVAREGRSVGGWYAIDVRVLRAISGVSICSILNGTLAVHAAWREGCKFQVQQARSQSFNVRARALGDDNLSP